ncbi:MAG: ABC transporter permease [Blastocatellia bacterium]|jgi:lipopolysaccharide transport system permease protein
MRIHAEEESASRPPDLVIEPTSGWRQPLALSDLWQYRELFYFLTWRDVKVRYKQTVLGAVWALLQPLGTMVLFAWIFGRVARLPSDGLPYPLFAFAGLIPWIFFSNALGSAGNSLVGSSHLITKVYFPRILIPASAVLAGLVDLGISMGALGGMMAWYGIAPSRRLLILPLLIGLTVLLALGVGLWLSALHVRFRDIRYIIPFLLQIWLFATPILYPRSILPEQYQWLSLLNPLSGLIEAYRGVLLGLPLDWRGVGLAAGGTMVLLITAIYGFRRMERTFADLV